MPRLVDIVLLDKTIVAQPLLGCRHVGFPAFTQGNCMLLERLPGSHLFGQGFRICHHDSEAGVGMPTAQCVVSQYAVGRVFLPIFDVAFKSRREHCHSPLAEKARQVLIEIAGIVERIAHGKHRAFAFGNRRQQHRRRRTGQSICRALPVTQQSGDSLSPLRSKKYIYQILFRIHLS